MRPAGAALRICERRSLRVVVGKCTSDSRLADSDPHIRHVNEEPNIVVRYRGRSRRKWVAVANQPMWPRSQRVRLTARLANDTDTGTATLRCRWMAGPRSTNVTVQRQT